MAEAGQSRGGLEAEEAQLARAAAAGDGEAFATLYERYAPRAYNLALRLCGSAEDASDAVQEAFLSVVKRAGAIEPERELAFGSYLFTATRNATYDLIKSQQRARPSDAIPEAAVPLGAGAGGLGLDPGDPGEDPDRNVLLASQQEEVRAANARLPERQREALALRELEEMSYDEIAAVMDMNRNSVAQLISRARINLRDELRGTALASVATSSAECERALPLIAARDDGQLAPDSEDGTWLDLHVGGCETCQVATAAMHEAGVSYRAWVPVAVAPLLFRETMARAAELVGGMGAEGVRGANVGAEWAAVAERRLTVPTDPARIPALPAAYRCGASGSRAAGKRGWLRGGGEGDAGRSTRRRRAALAGVLALLLIGGGAVVALSAGGGSSAPPGAETTEAVESTAADPERQPVSAGENRPDPKPAKAAAKKQRPAAAHAAPVETEPLPVSAGGEPAPSAPAKSKPDPEPKPAAQAPPPSDPKPKSTKEPAPSSGTGASAEPAPAPQPQPETVPPPATPPPAEPPVEEEPDPTPPPPIPGGPGDLKNPAPPGGPIP